MNKLSILLYLLISITSLMAEERLGNGFGPGNGGDYRKARIQILSNYIRYHLQNDLIDFVKFIDVKNIKGDTNQNIYSQMQEGLIKDIRGPKNLERGQYYLPRESCSIINHQNKEEPRLARAKFEKATPICFHVAGLIDFKQSSLPHLFAWALHEHAHHFQIKDLSHAFRQSIYSLALIYIDLHKKQTPHSNHAPIFMGQNKFNQLKMQSSKSLQVTFNLLSKLQSPYAMKLNQLNVLINTHFDDLRKTHKWQSELSLNQQLTRADKSLLISSLSLIESIKNTLYQINQTEVQNSNNISQGRMTLKARLEALYTNLKSINHKIVANIIPTNNMKKHKAYYSPSFDAQETEGLLACESGKSAAAQKAKKSAIEHLNSICALHESKCHIVEVEFKYSIFHFQGEKEYNCLASIKYSKH